MPKVPQNFWNVLAKPTFFSRLQTFLIMLMSGEFAGQFSRIFNPFSENQVFEIIDLCAGPLSCYNLLPKHISGKSLSCKICKYLIEFIVPQTFWRHFRPSRATKHQSINFFPPKFWISDKFFFSIPVLGKRWTNTCSIGCSSRVSRPKQHILPESVWKWSVFICWNFSGKSSSRRKIGFFHSNSGTQMMGDFYLSYQTCGTFFLGWGCHKDWVEIFWIILW